MEVYEYYFRNSKDCHLGFQKLQLNTYVPHLNLLMCSWSCYFRSKVFIYAALLQVTIIGSSTMANNMTQCHTCFR